MAARVTQQMLDEAKVTVLTKRCLQSAKKNGTRITAIVTSDGTFTAKVFVDATYEGDLMAAAGVSWTIGREGRAAYDESLAGKRFPKSKMNIDGFDRDGKPLPLITSTDAGPEAAGDKNVMVYSFRLCLTEDPNNRVSFPKPANYDASRFEIMRRYAKAGGRLGWDLYPLPGRKFDGNNSIGGQFSLGLVGGGNGWCEAGEAGRVTIWEAHKQYTLGLYHFLTTDPSVPAATRQKYSRLGLCKDEFPNYGHFSPALYVREGRRLRGMIVLSQKDILEEPQKNDPIVVSSFPIDSHDCQRIALKNGGVINEGTIFPVRIKGRGHGYAYHIPYRAILPKPTECANLLVPVALSCTHVAISSIRVEPTWMILGQSAGIAAALAADGGVAVQDVEYPQLRNRLLAQGQVLELPVLKNQPTTERRTKAVDPKGLPGVVLDDAAAVLKGMWKRSTNFKPHVGSGYVFCGKNVQTKGDGQATATFRFKVAKTGRYQLLMAYSAHETRAKNVPVTVSSGPHKKTLTVNQTAPLPAGKHFRAIGTVHLQADEETTIVVTNTDTIGFVILDALQLLAVN